MNNSPTGRRRVVVIGGGVSGLAAAHRVRAIAPEIDVRLFESKSRIGGVIETIRRDGFLIEGAADNFMTVQPEALDLCHELGLGDQLIPTGAAGCGAMVVHRGRLEPIPEGFAVMAPSRIWPLLATRILSPAGKLRSGMEWFVPAKRRDDDESLRAFITRRFGREMFDRLVQPLVGGIYTADPDRLSVAATMPRFIEMERTHGSLIRGMLAGRRPRGKAAGPAGRFRETPSGGARYSQFMTLRGGMSRLTDALESQLPSDSIRRDAQVQTLVRRGDRWTLRLNDLDETGVDADAVIVATPAAPAARMLASVDEPIADDLAKIQYASCAVASLAFRRDQIKHPLNSFGFVVPSIENRFILSCSFSSLKYEGRAPANHVLMRVFIGGACQAGLLRLPDRQLIELAHWELNKLLGIVGPPVVSHLTRQIHAMPQYHVGHRQLVTRIDQRMRSIPTLAIAGNALRGVGVPGCIASGRVAADRVLRALARDADATDDRIDVTAANDVLALSEKESDPLETTRFSRLLGHCRSESAPFSRRA